MLTDAGRPPSLAPRVLEMTEGNPFFVGEMARALGEGNPDEAAVTPRVRDVVRWRLARLPRAAADVLTAAAVAGPEFDADIVAAAAGIDAERTLDAIEAAERARLVRPAGVLDRFGFAHALVRQTIVGDLPAGRRVRLHARIARALEQASTLRAVAATDLAAHFDAASGLADANKTLHYARQAADEAAARCGWPVTSARARRCGGRHRTPNPPATARGWPKPCSVSCSARRPTCSTRTAR